MLEIGRRTLIYVELIHTHAFASRRQNTKHEKQNINYYQDRIKCPKSKHEFKEETVILSVLCLNQFSVCIPDILFCPGNTKYKYKICSVLCFVAH